MSESDASALSVRQLLVGDVSDEESASLLQKDLGPDVVDDLLADASSTLRGAAAAEVGRAISGVVKMDVIDSVTLGWRKHSLLTDAARRTLESPDSQEVVELASHSITSSYEPNIELLLDDRRVGQIDVSLKLTANVVGLLGVVQKGRLTALRSGHIDLTGVLTAQGAELAKGERRIDLAGDVSLGEGIDLIDHDSNPESQPV